MSIYSPQRKAIYLSPIRLGLPHTIARKILDHETRETLESRERRARGSFSRVSRISRISRSKRPLPFANKKAPSSRRGVRAQRQVPDHT